MPMRLKAVCCPLNFTAIDFVVKFNGGARARARSYCSSLRDAAFVSPVGVASRGALVLNILCAMAG